MASISSALFAGGGRRGQLYSRKSADSIGGLSDLPDVESDDYSNDSESRFDSSMKFDERRTQRDDDDDSYSHNSSTAGSYSAASSAADSATESYASPIKKYRSPIKHNVAKQQPAKTTKNAPTANTQTAVNMPLFDDEELDRIMRLSSMKDEKSVILPTHPSKSENVEKARSMKPVETFKVNNKMKFNEPFTDDTRNSTVVERTKSTKPVETPKASVNQMNQQFENMNMNNKYSNPHNDFEEDSLPQDEETFQEDDDTYQPDDYKEEVIEQSNYDDRHNLENIVAPDEDEFLNTFQQRSYNIVKTNSTQLPKVLAGQPLDDVLDEAYDPIPKNEQVSRIQSRMPSMEEVSVAESSIHGDQSAVGEQSLGAASSVDSSVHFAEIPEKPFNIDSHKFITPTNATMLKATKGMRDVTKQDLEMRSYAEELITKRKYDTLTKFIGENPRLIGIQANQPFGRTLLHVIAAQTKALPEATILKIVSHDPSLVCLTDVNMNTPLHYAAQTVRAGGVHAFLIFLKFHPTGASERNTDGDIPLHLAAANPMKGADEAVHLLLDAFKQGITVPNNRGKIPLHLALTHGSNNMQTMLSLVNMHKFLRSSISVLDNRGNSPLHAAIKHGSNHETVHRFNQEIRDSFLSAYTQENEEGLLPLHVALITKNVHPRVVLSFISSAPYTGGIPTPRGDMPITLATKQDMNPEIIKALLASDMPIEIGNRKRTTPGMGKIVEREHGHSWWHVAIECGEKYVDVIRSLLTDYATFMQVIALARCMSPDGKMTIEAASPALQSTFRNLLRFCYRYEISIDKLATSDETVQSFFAIDRGQDLEQKQITSPWLNDGFTSVAEVPRKMLADNTSHEVSFKTWGDESKEVLLRCYAYDDSFESELSTRKLNSISSEFVEDILAVHRVGDYVNPSFTTGKLLCIAFEANKETLKEFMMRRSQIDHQTWVVTCHGILREVAKSINHLHSLCLSHGNLDASTIANFGEKWKLLDIGGVTNMGSAMSGSVRRSIPPEALTAMKSSSSLMNVAENKSGNIIQFGPAGTTENTLNDSKRKIDKRKSKRSSNLPPLPKESSSRKRLGIFLFGMDNMGLQASRRENQKQRSRSRSSSRSRKLSKSKSQNDNESQGNFSAHSDEGSQRIIAMQEDEITRLRKALEEKEQIYRKQLAQERAAFKRQEVERERELQRTIAKQNIEKKESLLSRFAPEKVMASPSWDIWSFGVVMVELFVGKTILPSCAKTEEEFLEKLMKFDEVQLSAVREEVRDVAGDLAADLVTRLLHPKPQQRIGSIAKVLQHKYFHEEIQIIHESAKKKNKKKK